MPSRTLIRRCLVPVLGIGLLIGFAKLGWEPAVLQQRLREMGPWAPLVFVFAGVILMSVLVPKTIMSITAGALFGTWLGSFLMLLTAVAAALANYWIGRKILGQDFLQRKKMLGTDGLDVGLTPTGRRQILVRTMVEMASEAGFIGHLLVRLSPVPTMLISYTMGICHARQRPYLLAAAVAVVPQMLWVHGGTAASLVQSESATAGSVGLASWVSVGLAIIGGMLVSVLIPRAAIHRIRAASRPSHQASSSS